MATLTQAIDAPVGSQVTQLRRQFATHEALVAAQPAYIRDAIAEQARQLAEALAAPAALARILLPDTVVTRSGDTVTVPAALRVQTVSLGALARLRRESLADALRRRLDQLEAAPDEATATAGALLRHSAAEYLVQAVPAGRRLVRPPADAGNEHRYQARTGEPDCNPDSRPSLPEWVAFDDEAHLLVPTLADAEACLATLQHYVRILDVAVTLAPYIVADSAYQQARFELVDQLAGQGRAYGRYRTGEIIRLIREGGSQQRLNRGIQVAMPYFDDEALELRQFVFWLIPPGRIMYAPAFIVRGARVEQARVAQDTRLSGTTRQSLLAQLKLLERAFLSTAEAA